MDKRIVEKFFRNRCTTEELEQVLEWFDTPEGRQYLEQRLSYDFKMMDEKNLGRPEQQPASQKMLSKIKTRISRKGLASGSRFDLPKSLLRFSAAALVILTVTAFYQFIYKASSNEVAVSAPIHYVTEDDQQKELILGDGTKIHMNNNTHIWIKREATPEGNREVELKGEAYFEVESNPDRPFVIQANQSTVRVLGTSFNVRSFTEEKNVQVAVLEGSVSLESAGDRDKQESAILSEGEYGLLSLDERNITVEDYAVENYLSWMKGRLVFDELPLNQVCSQLNKLYGLECSYAGQDLEDLPLTANFSNDTLEKTLSVISMSLDLSYQKTGNEIVWSDSNRTSEDNR